MSKFKQNWLLYVAFGAPIIMVAVVAASIYLPNRNHKPQYDFVFSEGYYQYDGSGWYTIDGSGKLTQTNSIKESGPKGVPIPPYPPNISADQKLFLYDVRTDSAKELSLVEAQKFTYDSQKESPDGFYIDYGSRAGSDGFPFFFFGSTDYSSRYILGHGSQKKLNLPNINSTYSPYNFQFVGWVLQK